jgi:hypothetical protein
MPLVLVSRYRLRGFNYPIKFSIKLVRILALGFSTRKSESILLKEYVSDITKQKLSLLSMISSDDYKLHLEFYNKASVGAHIRHSLDHFQRLLSIHSNDLEIFYDIRDRNNPLENEKTLAIDCIKTTHSSLLSLCDENLETLVWPIFDSSSFNTDVLKVKSTLGRELLFVCHHSVHHISTIKFMMQYMGYTVNSSIGVANSTQLHNKGVK